MADATELLQQLGFGEYEARAYVALLQRNPLNGYELAKASGIPRPNIYAVLQKLEERNVVVRLDSTTGTRYAPVLPGELTERLGSRLHNLLDTARTSLEEVVRPCEYDYVWNIQGHAALLEHAAALTNLAQKQLIVAFWQPEAQVLAEAMAKAQARGVGIQTLCLQACPQECVGCRGTIYRYHVTVAHPSRWLIIVQDGAEMLLGDISPDRAMAMRTRQHSFIEMAAWYIRHSIAMAAVVGELGDKLDQLLRPETLSLLQSVGPGGGDGGWLQYMIRLLKGEEGQKSA